MKADVFMGLYNLYVDEPSEERVASKSDMSTNSSNHLLTNGNGRSSNAKIIIV